MAGAFRPGRGPSALVVILASVAFLAFSCSAKPKADPRASSPSVSNTQSVPELKVSFTEPRGWVRIDDAAIKKLRDSAEGVTQVGCFNAVPELGFAGPSGEQFVFSALKPNANYEAGQSALSQMNRHSAFMKMHFSSKGRTMTDKIDIGGMDVYRLSCQGDSDYYFKFFFLPDKKDASRCFGVDVIVPINVFNDEVNTTIGKSLLSFAKS